MGRVTVTVELHPTEDEDKVRRAVENVLEASEWRVEEEGDGLKRLVAASTLHGLNRMREKLRRQRTLDAARYMMKRFSTPDKLVFYLHKQAAYAGYVVFCLPEGESPLGPIEVVVEAQDLKKALDWLAPPTSEGKPKYEVPMPEDP
ncbi:MAG: hypothetical protein DRJ97_04070 [Thermoprotei archaeon]|nr:MAG: hypothetical protein DRJ97_04070 [Thermoprotei archaeon]